MNKDDSAQNDDLVQNQANKDSSLGDTVDVAKEFEKEVKGKQDSGLSELEKTREALQKQKNLVLRAQADLENYQRREMENKTQWSRMAIIDFLQSLFPTFLEMSLFVKNTKDEDAKRILLKFFETLEKKQLKQIIPKQGDLVNPEKHMVVMAVEGIGIVEVFEPGWEFMGNVISLAKVSAGKE